MEVRRLRDKLILASLVLIVPFVLWNVLTQVYRYRENYTASLERNQTRARDVSERFLGHLDSLIALQKVVGLAVWDESRPDASVSDYLAYVAESTPAVRHISAADASGIIFSSSEPELVGTSMLDRSLCVRRIMEGADAAISSVFWQPETRRHLIGVVTAHRVEGQLQGMVLTGMDEDDLRQAIRRNIRSSDQLTIIDSTGVVALTDGPADLTWEERDWRHLAFVKKAIGGQPSTVEALVLPDGRTMMGAAEPIRQFGWAACAMRPRMEVLGPLRRQTARRSLAVLALIGLVVAAAVFLGNRLTRPVLDLAKAAKALGAGNLRSRVSVETRDELEFLAQAFNSMAAALEDRTRQLNDAMEAERRQVEKTSALYSVAHGLVVSMSLQERLDIITRALASICNAERSIIVLLKGDILSLESVWGPGMEVLEGMRLQWPGVRPGDEEAFAQGQPILIKDISEYPLMNPKDFERFSMKGYVGLPLACEGHVVGFATLDNPGRSPDFPDECIESARVIASLAATAIQNARIFEKEKNIAQSLQKSLLPSLEERLGEFRFACEYHSAFGEAELGGDFYDIIRISDTQVGIVVGDVSGKGLEAAVSTAMGKYTLRAFISEDPEPGCTFTRANKALVKCGDWGFVTMFYATLDLETGWLRYASAGHPPALLASKDGEVYELMGSDAQPPLGSFDSIRYISRECLLRHGDVLVSYTDGVIEARHDGEFFEVDRLCELIREARELEPKAIAERIYRAVVEYSLSPLQDDIALMVIKRD